MAAAPWSRTRLYAPGRRVTYAGQEWVAAAGGRGARPPEWPWIPIGGGSGTSGPVHHTVEIAFDTPNLDGGVAIFTPAVGDLLLDAWIEITESFDADPAAADFGSFVGANGVLSEWLDGPLDIVGKSPDDLVSGLLLPNRQLALATANYTASDGQFLPGAYRVVPTAFGTTDPFKVLISDDGTPGGDPIGGTTGAATIHALVLPVT